ncbi:MAG: hypothetical protein M3Q14_03105 [bacterium]|nr:hypothetical protein [bacterium]
MANLELDPSFYIQSPPEEFLRAVPDHDPKYNAAEDVDTYDPQNLSILRDHVTASFDENNNLETNNELFTSLTQAKDLTVTNLKISLETLNDKAPRFLPRAAKREDVEQMVEIDLVAFGAVYRDYELTAEELRADLKNKFLERYEILGGDWMQVLEDETGKMCGFMICCPTSKQPEDFVSWEDMTDGGTLASTYDPDGKQLYVVSLSMLPEGSKYDGQDILYLNLLGKMVENGIGRAFFESRLPGLRSWVKKQCRKEDRNPEDLSEDEKLEHAKSYVNLRKTVDGKSVRHDQLLRIFEDFNAEFVKVAPDAYQDKPSMNFGVVCVIKNPLPERIQEYRLPSILAGKFMRFASKHPGIMKRLF